VEERGRAAAAEERLRLSGRSRQTEKLPRPKSALSGDKYRKKLLQLRLKRREPSPAEAAAAAAAKQAAEAVRREDERQRRDERAKRETEERRTAAKAGAAAAAKLDLSEVGASHVRISGVVLRQGGNERPYRGINGEYRRSDNICNGRPVYIKKSKQGIAMWWANAAGKLSWCVGPKDFVGGCDMWAYVESEGFGPEEAGGRAWSVYSYDSGAWEEQVGVRVENLEPPEVEVIQSRPTSAMMEKAADSARSEDERQRREEEERMTRAEEERQRRLEEERKKQEAEVEEAPAEAEEAPAEGAAAAAAKQAEETVEAARREREEGREEARDLLLPGEVVGDFGSVLGEPPASFSHPVEAPASFSPLSRLYPA